MEGSVISVFINLTSNETNVVSLAGMVLSIASILVSRHSLYDLIKVNFLDEIRSKKD
jgi:hypothetical protein